ncbi:MAG: peptidoglycan-binding protein, partial [Bacteroidota bacterium]
MFVSACCLFSCKEEKTSFEHWIEENGFNDSLYHEALKNRFSEDDSALICHSGFNFFDTLAVFYSGRNYEPLFTKAITDSITIDTLLFYFDKSTGHGLLPGMFDSELIRWLREEYLHKALKDSVIDYDLLATLELTLANATLKYSLGMQCGFTDPNELYGKSYNLPFRGPDSLKWFTVFEEEDLGKYFRSIAPSAVRYKELQKALAWYYRLRELGGWDSIPYTDPDIKIEFGDTTGILDTVAQRLLVTGELEDAYRDSAFPAYDSSLFKAVKRYQLLNGLLADGVIGRRTLDEMNTPVDNRIRQICVNLERFRWLTYPPDSGQFVLVNIPEFHLYGYDNGKVKVDMHVCVGEKRDKNYDERMKRWLKTKKKWDKPNNHETPCMEGRITHFI